MINTTVAWIALPFFTGFIIYLLPKLARPFALGIALISAAYAWQLFLGEPLEIQLLDSFGVSLICDRLSGWFILTNAIVTTAVIIYCWGSNKTAYFYLQIIMLHGSVNATFICADFISLYVALEVISIAAFLLITYPRTDKSIWVGLRYLFVSNTAMLFYLIGAVLVYQANHSFYYGGLVNASLEAIALIFLGLLAKGGIFVSGFWLPLTHSEAQSPVSAMLSGVVVKAGVFPLVRCALLLEEIEPIVRTIGVGTALLGVIFAMLEKDTKRTLAFSTISQIGFILAAPVVGGFYALTHGLAKSTSFLTAGKLPSRDFAELKQRGISTPLWIVLVIAGLSISGFPLLAGFSAKALTADNLLYWQKPLLNIATVGTTITFAKFIFLPHRISPHSENGVKENHRGYWLAMTLLIGGLIAANSFKLEVYTLKNLIKPIITIALGWIIYLIWLRRATIKLPRTIEQFDRLIGDMSLTLILLFWLLWTRFYLWGGTA